MKIKHLLTLFAIGLISITAQTCAVREFITSMRGNELLLGLFFGTWLFWVGVGSLASKLKQIKSINTTVRLFYPLTVLAQILAFIFYRQIFNINSWELITLDKSFLAIILLFLE